MENSNDKSDAAHMLKENTSRKKMTGIKGKQLMKKKRVGEEAFFSPTRDNSFAVMTNYEGPFSDEPISDHSSSTITPSLNLPPDSFVVTFDDTCKKATANNTKYITADSSTTSIVPQRESNETHDLRGERGSNSTNQMHELLDKIPTILHKENDEGFEYPGNNDEGFKDGSAPKLEEKYSTQKTLLDKMQLMACQKKDAPFATWYNEKGHPTDEYTFEALWQEAGVIAHYVKERWRIQKGDRVVLCYNLGLPFFASFLGCLRAGIIAVPVYPPGRPLIRSLMKMNKIISDSRPTLILTDSKVMLLRRMDKLDLRSESKDLWPPAIKFKETDKINNHGRDIGGIFGYAKKKKDRIPEKCTYNEPNIQPNDIAFLQYTSGSTGNPKGVMVTFSALQANVQLIQNGLIQGCTNDLSKLIGFSWLPQYHDLGLIYAFVAPFVYGGRMHMMSPITFIKRPLLWLELMSHLKVSWSVAPDFAYNLVIRKFLEAKDKPTINLSAIHHLQNGAEPIRNDTQRKFKETFSQHGLREDWFSAGYGLAENVVGVCYLHRHVICPPNEEIKDSSRVAVGSRKTFDKSLTVKIISQDKPKELEDGEVGEIWVSGPSVAAGYFGKPELSKEVFEARLPGDEKKYLRTGDLGFFKHDYFFVCGRLKDLIIVNGTNYYPQDIEMAIQDSVPGVRAGCIAAFSTNENDGYGNVEVVFEIRKTFSKDAADICSSAQSATLRVTGLQTKRITAILEKTIPKTTSGKICRRATQEALYAGNLHVIHDYHSSASAFLKTTKSDGHCVDRLRQLQTTKSGTFEKNTNVSNIFETNYDVEKGDNNITKVLFNKNSIPTSHLPPVVINTVLGITCDIAKLEIYFNEMRLNKIPTLVAAWKQTEKSTKELHNVCKESLNAMVDRHPTAVQFAHLLVAHPDWILEGGHNMLIEVVHCGFVLEWATRQFVHDIDLLKQKIALDDAYEALLGLELADVPKEAQFFIDDKKEDALFSILDTFSWMKHRSIYQLLSSDLLMENSCVCDWGRMNILEGCWLDNIRGYKENASVGEWLAEHTARSIKSSHDHIADIESSEENVPQMYWMWNLSLILSMDSRPVTMSQLLIPCISSAGPKEFAAFRCIALYLTTHHYVHQFLESNDSPKPLFSEQAIRCFGILNKEFLSSKVESFALDQTQKTSPPDFSYQLDLSVEKTKNEWYKFFNWLALEKEKMTSSITPSDDFVMTLSEENNTDHSQIHSDKCGRKSDLDPDPFEAIMHRFFGTSYSPEKSWEEIGMASMLSLGVCDEIRKTFHVALDPDCFEIFTTPMALRGFVMGNKGTPLQINLTSLPQIQSLNLSWWSFGFIQACCSALLILAFSFSIVPAWYIGKFLANGGDDIDVTWFCFPVIVAVWMMSFSTIVIALKWLMIWKYQEGIVFIPSIRYLQWWFVDRAIDLWEFWVGRFILDTLLINVFYYLMGAKIDWSVSFGSFIREFDLIEINKRTLIQYPIKCRTFGAWHENEGPTLRFRSIYIGHQCDIKGMISPGVNIGYKTSVENLSVVSEGAEVPESSRIVGNPGFIAEEQYCSKESLSDPQSILIEISKMLWLTFELYSFWGVIYLGQHSWVFVLPQTWRYSSILKWCLLILWFNVVSIGSSILLKWVLIGKRKPGIVQLTAWRTLADWFTDWHFKISLGILQNLTFFSHMWNVVLMLHGMDIDFASQLVSPDRFLPSQVDLFMVRKSFVSTISFDAECDGAYHKMSIKESSIGMGTHLAGKDLTLLRTVVPPLTNVTNSIVKMEQDSQAPDINNVQFFWQEIQMTIGYVAIFASILGTLIPPYELWVHVIGENSTVWIAAPTLAFSLILHTVSLTFVLALFQGLMMPKVKECTKYQNNRICSEICQCIASIYANYSFQRVIVGSQLYNYTLKMLGAKIEGQALLLPKRIYDTPCIFIADKTIVDSSFISGHYAVFNNITIGPCSVGGLLHGGSCVANALITDPESGPLRAYVGTYQGNISEV